MSQFHLPCLSSPVSLYATSNAKKQSESEANKLANRIQFLRMEQLKLDKKIASNNERAMKIYTQKIEQRAEPTPR